MRLATVVLATTLLSGCATGQPYVSVGGGVSIQRDMELRPEIARLEDLSVSEFDPGQNVGGAVGYAWEHFRLEVEGRWRRSQMDTVTINETDTWEYGDASLGQATGLVNGWFQQKLADGWQVYAGGGVGASMMRLDAATVTSPDGEVLDLDYGAWTQAPLFTWQVGAGVWRRLNEHLVLDVGYRYIESTKPEFPGAFEDINARNRAHEVQVNLTWTW